MRAFLNIIWYFPYLGFLSAFFVALYGLIISCTVVGLPIGLGLFQIAKYLLLPHSRALVSKKEVRKLQNKEQNQIWQIFSTIISILYIPFIGLPLSILYILYAVGCFATILGIPNGLVIMRMIPAIFNPIGKICVPRSVAEHMQNIKDEATVNEYFGNQQTQDTTQQTTALPPVPPVKTIESRLVGYAHEARSYSDEKLNEVIEKHAIYNTDLVTACRREIEIRCKSNELMSEVDKLTISELIDVIEYPDRYSPEYVYCAEKSYASKLETERIAEIERQKEEEQQREAELKEIARQQEEKRQKQKQAVKDFIAKWKYAILVGLILLITCGILLWYHSDANTLSMAAKAYSVQDYKKASEHAAKIDDIGSKYFDYAIIIGLMAEHELTPDSVDMQENIFTERINALIKNEDNIDKHIPLLYYCFSKSYPLPMDYLSIADKMMSSNDRQAIFTAGLTNFVYDNYQGAKMAFSYLSQNTYDQYYELSLSFLGIIDLFNLADVVEDKSTAWKNLRDGCSYGLFGLFKGDAHLINDEDRLSVNIENALTAYNSSSVPEILEPALSERRTIMENLQSKHLRYSTYNFENGEYYGDASYHGYSQGADGWGVFVFNNGSRRYGNYKYTSNNKIANIKEVYISNSGESETENSGYIDRYGTIHGKDNRSYRKFSPFDYVYNDIVISQSFYAPINVEINDSRIALVNDYYLSAVSAINF